MTATNSATNNFRHKGADGVSDAAVIFSLLGIVSDAKASKTITWRGLGWPSGVEILGQMK